MLSNTRIRTVLFLGIRIFAQSCGKILSSLPLCALVVVLLFMYESAKGNLFILSGKSPLADPSIPNVASGAVLFSCRPNPNDYSNLECLIKIPTIKRTTSNNI